MAICNRCDGTGAVCGKCGLPITDARNWRISICAECLIEPNQKKETVKND